MPVKSTDDSWDRGDSLQTDGMVIILLPEESMNEDTQKLHEAECETVYTILRLVVIRRTNLLKVFDRKTGWKGLILVCELLVTLVSFQY